MEGELNFTLHKYQEKLLKSDKRFLAAIAGIQSGKTWFGCIWLIKEILKGWDEGKDYSYLIAAPTYKILQQSTLRKWLELAPSWLGDYKEQKSVYELRGGRGIVYIRSTEEAVGLEGMTLKAAWLDEAGQMSDIVWRIIQGRLAILNGRLLVTTTPYSFNWVYHEFIRSKADDREAVVWESKENPWFPKEEYKRQLKLAKGDPNLMADFEKRYRGIFRQVAGKVYQSWHPRFVLPEFPKNQNFKEFVGGIDWGYTNPAAVEVIGVSDYKPKFVVVDEWYQPGKVIEDIAQACVELMKKWKVRLFYADPSRPDYIQELNSRRIPVMVGDNDLAKGIANLQRLIKNEDLYITNQCSHLLEEIDLYHYPEIIDGAMKEEPVKDRDHGLDAIRYAIATHVPIQIVQVKEEKPIWKMIKESVKQVDPMEEGMAEWFYD